MHDARARVALLKILPDPIVGVDEYLSTAAYTQILADAEQAFGVERQELQARVRRANRRFRCVTSRRHSAC
jgi:hypothetical protein